MCYGRAKKEAVPGVRNAPGPGRWEALLKQERSDEAVALATDVTAQGSTAVQDLIRRIQQRSVTGMKARAGVDAAGGLLGYAGGGLLLGDQP